MVDPPSDAECSPLDIPEWRVDGTRSNRVDVRNCTATICLLLVVLVVAVADGDVPSNQALDIGWNSKRHSDTVRT